MRVYELSSDNPLDLLHNHQPMDVEPYYFMNMTLLQDISNQQVDFNITHQDNAPNVQIDKNILDLWKVSGMHIRMRAENLVKELGTHIRLAADPDEKPKVNITITKETKSIIIESNSNYYIYDDLKKIGHITLCSKLHLDTGKITVTAKNLSN